MKDRCLLNNEDGSVLIVALIMLVLLTLIGISATTTSEIETKIAGNERVFKRNLYLAEAGAMHCAQDLEGITDLKANPPGYLHPKGTVDDTNIRDDTFWESTAPVNSQVSTIDANTRLLASSLGLAGGKKGTSLDLTKSNVHAYNIYGRWHNAAIPSKGRLIVEVGYRKAF
jgi:hypothetical protein